MMVPKAPAISMVATAAFPCAALEASSATTQSGTAYWRPKPTTTRAVADPEASPNGRHSFLDASPGSAASPMAGPEALEVTGVHEHRGARREDHRPHDRRADTPSQRATGVIRIGPSANPIVPPTAKTLIPAPRRVAET